MIVDASAMLAIMLGEPDAEDFLDAIVRHDCQMSMVTYMEIVLRVERMSDRSFADTLDDRLDRSGVRLAPVSLAHTREARRAFQRFGKGIDPARLNLGDCFAYALAKVSGDPLLFKGGDFSRTDIASAL